MENTRHVNTFAFDLFPIKIWFVIFIFLVGFRFVIAVELTGEEKAWIAAHPDIRLGVSESWAPFIFPDKDSMHTGFAVDMIRLINERIGTNINIVPGAWNQIVPMARKRELDGLAISSPLEFRREFFNFTNPYLSQYYTLITSPNNVDSIRSIADLQGKTLAYLDDNAWIEKLISSIGDVKAIPTDSEVNSFELVLAGKADASFLPAALYSEMKKQFHDNVAIAYVFSEEEYIIDIVYSIRKDWPVLVSILNKALASISLQKKNDIYEKWVGLPLNRSKSWIRLTEQEQAWLQQHPVIRIAPDPSFPPIEWFEKDNNYVGISADIMNLIKMHLGIEFYIVQCDNWQQVLQKARNRQVDLLPAASQTPERAEYMDFSDPYLEFPGVILTLSKNKNLNRTTLLYGKKVGIVSDYVWSEFIKKDHPQIQISEMENVIEGLRQVATGEIDAFIATLPVALYYIEQEGIHNLVVAGETEYKTRLSILTRNDWPLLHSVIRKTLSNIPKSNKTEIIQKWLSIKQKKVFTKTVVWYISLAVVASGFIILIVVMSWNKTLRNRVQLKTAELQASKETYRNIFQNAQVGLYRTRITDGKILESNTQLASMFGYQDRKEFISEYITSESYVDPGTREAMLKELEEKGSVQHFEARFYRKDGSIFWARFSARIFPEKGWIEGVAEDISAHKKTIDELEKLKHDLEIKVKEQTNELQEKIRKANKAQKAMLYMVEDLNRITSELKAERRKLEFSNKELESFSYSVSHDLRAPLRAMDGFSRALLEDYGNELGEQGRDYANRVRTASQRMGILIDDLLQLSRAARYEMTPTRVNISDLAKSEYDRLRDMDSEHNVQMNIKKDIYADGDIHLLHLVLQNLLGNAWKFTRDKDTAQIDFGVMRNAECDPPNPDVQDNELVYYVCDNGAGFDPNYADKLFQPFQRLHSEQEFPGTGIGLATVQRIIRRHRGSVWARGAVDQGGVFYFTLNRQTKK